MHANPVADPAARFTGSNATGHSCAQSVPAADAAPALTLRDVTVAYHDRVVLRDVSLQLAVGRVTALLGPSGCGKSSLLQCCNRLSDLIDGCRVQGNIRVFGEDILAAACDLRRLRKRVGMIFQKANPFPLSIRRNIELPLIEHGVRDAQQRDHIMEKVLRDVGLWQEVRDRLQAPAQSLSGGQQQRLCIARALALAPDILLMDEPCSALDPIAGGRIEELIGELRGRYSIVLVTHNLFQARRVADDVALLWPMPDGSRLLEFAPRETIFSAPQHELTGLYLRGAMG